MTMYECESELKMMTITEEETNKHWNYLNLLEQNIGILNYEDDKEKSRMIMYRLSVDEFVCNVCEYVYV